ncbi:hypothetical protein [Halopelagius longus]|uniref:Uncharacterized protein n=1 Tax=Halopelagius longus TaxID=1236180 RepID=A0A1H1DUR1_9EURY|nr:hypothetical protein [Halopelagius longus]RDI71470.1 hypothetical protein DWB78_06910 [Halopelagius longus]SDQ79968.1 hypothetical protein SAMN05216278_2583 [Halopelagius longus]
MADTTEGSADHRPITGLTRWFLLSGDRLLVSLVLLFGVGAAFFAVGILDLATVTTPNRVMWYLNGTVNGLLTLVPITVGVNQIVLSHEFGSVQDLYERRTDITDFRERVEDRTGTSVSSPHASPFFGTLLSAVSDAAGTAQDRFDRSRADERVANDVAEITQSVIEEAERTNDELAADDTSMLRTFLTMLDYRNSGQFHDVRRIQAELSDSDAETAEELQRITELFVEVDAARQFLKTVVVERQLARLSRLLVYTGVPAVTVATIGIFSYRDIAGLTLPHAALVGVAGAIIVATLVPLAILSAYILRVATIAHQTAVYGPFIPESDD